MQAEEGDHQRCQCCDDDEESFDSGWDVQRCLLEDDIHGLKHRDQLLSQLYGRSLASLQELSLSCETITNLLPEYNVTCLADNKNITYPTIGYNSEDWYGNYLPDLRKEVAEKYSLEELYGELYNVVKGGDEDNDTDNNDDDVIGETGARSDIEGEDVVFSGQCNNNDDSANKEDINDCISQRQRICEEEVVDFEQHDDYDVGKSICCLYC